MIYSSILYLFLISSYGFIIEILKYLSLALSTILVEKIQKMFFKPIFNWLIISWFKVLYYILSVNLTAKQFCASPNYNHLPSYINLLLFK